MTDPIRVLLADDHAMVRAGIRQFLEISEQICVVAEAGDGEAVKAMLSDARPDVLLIDIKMPHLNGIETTRWIRTHHPDLGVLILSAFDDEAYVMAVLNAGANGYMLKSSSPNELIEAVVGVHNGRSALHPTIAHRLINMIANARQTSETEPLTPREMETLTLVGQGKTNKEIGHELSISSRTVQSHLANIYQKLDVSNRTEAILRATALGVIQLET